MKKIIIQFSVFFIVFIAQAQTDISQIVLSMPDHLLIGLDEEQKNELVAINPDSTGVFIESRLNENVERLALTKDYIAIKTSESGTLEIKMLPLVNNTEIIGVITTVCGPACDSRIDFYTTSWELLKQPDLFPETDKSRFLKQDVDMNSDDVKNAYAVLDMTPVKLSFSPDNNDVTAEYDIKNYLYTDDYKLLEPYLINEPVIFKWDKFSYK